MLFHSPLIIGGPRPREPEWRANLPTAPLIVRYGAALIPNQFSPCSSTGSAFADDDERRPIVMTPLKPASPAVPAASAKEENKNNNDEKCLGIHDVQPFQYDGQV